MKYCEKCFKKIDKYGNGHAIWCPNKKNDVDFEDLFPGINKIKVKK